MSEWVKDLISHRKEQGNIFHVQVCAEAPQRWKMTLWKKYDIICSIVRQEWGEKIDTTFTSVFLNLEEEPRGDKPSLVLNSYGNRNVHTTICGFSARYGV